MRVLEIPLGAKQFRWFLMTHWVLCPDNRSEKGLSLRRGVLIRQGKSGAAFLGIAVKVVRGSLDQVFSKINHNQLIPESEDQSMAKAMIKKFIGTHEKYVAIRWEES
jgi:hypothetical protein